MQALWKVGVPALIASNGEQPFHNPYHYCLTGLVLNKLRMRAKIKAEPRGLLVLSVVVRCLAFVHCRVLKCSLLVYTVLFMCCACLW